MMAYDSLHTLWVVLDNGDKLRSAKRVTILWGMSSDVTISRSMYLVNLLSEVQPFIQPLRGSFVAADNMNVNIQSCFRKLHVNNIF